MCGNNFVLLPFRKAQGATAVSTGAMKTPLRPISGQISRLAASAPMSSRKRTRENRTLFQEEQADPISVSPFFREAYQLGPSVRCVEATVRDRLHEKTRKE